MRRDEGDLPNLRWGWASLSTCYLDSEGIQALVFTQRGARDPLGLYQHHDRGWLVSILAAHSEEHEAAVSAAFSGERLFQLMQEFCRGTRASCPVRRQGTGKELPP
jgi:hypothetical protein